MKLNREEVNATYSENVKQKAKYDATLAEIKKLDAVIQENWTGKEANASKEVMTDLISTFTNLKNDHDEVCKALAVFKAKVEVSYGE